MIVFNCKYINYFYTLNQQVVLPSKDALEVIILHYFKISEDIRVRIRKGGEKENYILYKVRHKPRQRFPC